MDSSQHPNRTYAPHPWALGLAALLAGAGVFACDALQPLAAFWLVLALSLVVMGEGRPHAHFLGFVCLPMFLALLLVWVVALPMASPGGVTRMMGLSYSARIVFRIAAFGALFQLCFLPLLREGRLVETLRAWGLKGDGLLIAIASVTLLDDLRYRLEQVTQARVARGLASGGALSRLTQLPSLLRPLLIFILTSGVKRAELWAHRHLRQRLTEMNASVAATGSPVASVAFLIGAVAWLGVALFFPK